RSLLFTFCRRESGRTEIPWDGTRQRLSAAMVEESLVTRSTAPVAAVEVAVQPSRAIGPKILLYSHDTFGLGNIHRTLLVAAALKRLRRPPRIVLGLRDILDEPARTRHALAKSHAFATIERYYDEVWVYGTPVVFDTVREYGFPEAVARKTAFCGYLRTRTEGRPSDGGAPRV